MLTQMKKTVITKTPMKTAPSTKFTNKWDLKLPVKP